MARILNNLFIVSIGVLLFVKPLFAYDKPTLAVLKLESPNVDSNTVSAIIGLIQTKLSESNLYKMVERDRLEKVFEEQDIQHYTSLTNRATVVKLGEILNAQKLVLGEVTNMDGAYLISSRIVDVQTGEIEASASEKAKNVLLLDDTVNRLVKELTEKSMSEYQAFLRSLAFGNSFRTSAGLFMFTGDVKNADSSSIDYDISYRRKGLPFIDVYNFHTEYEVGYFLVENNKSKPLGLSQKINYIPVSVSVQYFLPGSFFADIYAKAGGGVSYGIAQAESPLLGRIKNETSLDPFVKAGIGFDTSKKYRLGVFFECLYNQFFMKGTDLTGITFNAGFSYNW